MTLDAANPHLLTWQRGKSLMQRQFARLGNPDGALALVVEGDDGLQVQVLDPEHALAFLRRYPPLLTYWASVPPTALTAIVWPLGEMPKITFSIRREPAPKEAPRSPAGTT